MNQFPRSTRTGPMRPRPEHGENGCEGSARLAGRAAIIAGGIGRTAAIASAREGTDLPASCRDGHDDAEETRRRAERAGRRRVLVAGDVRDAGTCRSPADRTIADRAMAASGRRDIPVDNAVFRMERTRVEDIGATERRGTRSIDVDAMFHPCRTARPRLKTGGGILDITSVGSNIAPPRPITCDATRAAIVDSTAGQPAEAAPPHVSRASDGAGRVTGARRAVAGGVSSL